MKKLYKRKIIALIATIITIAAFYGFTQFSIKKQIKPTTVVIATQDIPPNTKITKDMVAYTKIPGDAIPPSEKVVVNSKNVVGYYTAPGYGISKNSLIYGKKISKKEERPDEGVLSLKPNENTFSFKVDITSTHGNAIIPGQKLDLYTAFLYQDPKENSLGDNRKPFFGRLVKDARVLTVRDNKGKDVYSEENYTINKDKKDEETQKIGSPSVITVAVDIDSLKYLNTARMIGTLLPVANGMSSPYLDIDKMLDGKKVEINPANKDIYDTKITREFLNKISLDPKAYIPYFASSEDENSLGYTMDEIKEEYQKQIDKE